MAQWVVALAANPGNLNLIPKTHTTEEENKLLPDTHTHTLINKMVCSVTHSFPSSQNWNWSSPLVPLTLMHTSVAFLSLTAFQLV